MSSKEKQLAKWFLLGLILAGLLLVVLYRFMLREQSKEQDVIYITPQEVIDAYVISMNELKQELATSTISHAESIQRAEDIFLSVRVPEGQRDRHLKTFLQLKDVSSTADIVLLIDALLKE